MKAHEIAKAFADIFAADEVIDGYFAVEQSGETLTRPALIFECTTRALTDTGKALTYVLTIIAESNAEKAQASDPDPADAHSANVEAVRQKLHGTGKANLLQQLNFAAPYGIDFRNWSAIESDPALESHHFRTPLSIAGVTLVL